MRSWPMTFELAFSRHAKAVSNLIGDVSGLTRNCTVGRIERYALFAVNCVARTSAMAGCC